MEKPCEVTYRMVASPLGKLQLSGCQQGLHGIRLLGRKTPDPGPAEAPGHGGMPEPLVQCAAWLDAYFHRPAALQELPVPALHHPVFQRDSFTRQVLWKLLKVVKFGDVVSYQQLAALAGSPNAARAVGGAMRSNPGMELDTFSGILHPQSPTPTVLFISGSIYSSHKDLNVRRGPGTVQGSQHRQQRCLPSTVNHCGECKCCRYDVTNRKVTNRKALKGK
ncbi:methylated-DNA--protein-cysteine methyltransferase isoform X1 [Rhinolophus sinicus]|uniref:methylated-DNA--protein-cysteine methyltransferase isoform X1 n=1 Tax=Rhinolophus sinicus TaxID=89399 RepID=UPI003D79D1A1